MHTTEKALTLINVFPVKPEQQDELIEILTRASAETMKYLDGFLWACVYRGINGTHVANYVQWRSREDFDRMLEKPEAQRHFAEVHRVTRGNPQLYELASVIEGIYQNGATQADENTVLTGQQKRELELAESK